MVFPSFSALLYLNGDFDGGDFIFTEMDAKTVTVRKNNRAFFSSVISGRVWHLKALFLVVGVSEAQMRADGGVLFRR